MIYRPLFIALTLTLSAPAYAFSWNDSTPAAQSAVLSDIPVIQVEEPKPLATTPVKTTAAKVVTVDLTRPTQDIWQRIRNGFAMQNLDSQLVFDQLARYLSQKTYLTQLLERSRPYLYMIVEEIEKRGMPTELALLPMVESAYNPMALSNANASGLWQFIPSTGKIYGLEQNWWVDQRRDVIASTQAALDYLKYTYEMHGDWQLALASYNWGEGAVGRAIEKNETRDLPTDYMNLRLPDETRNYVPKLQALKNIIAFPHLYRVRLPHIPNEPYLSTIRKERSIDVKLAAELAEMPLADFLALNPSFKRPIIPAEEDGAQIVLPSDRVNIFMANLEKYKAENRPLVSWTSYTLPQSETVTALAAQLNTSAATLRSANGLTEKTRILPAGTTILTPLNGTVSASDTSSSDKAAARLTATQPSAVSEEDMLPPPDILLAGDTDSIDIPPSEARGMSAGIQTMPSTHEKTVAAVQSDNQINQRAAAISSDLQENYTPSDNDIAMDDGDVRIIRASATIPVRQANPLGYAPDITEQITNPPLETQTVLAPDSDTKTTSKPRFYVVKKNDTLAAIARRYNLSVADLRRMNGLKSNTIRRGQRLKVGTTARRAQKAITTRYTVKKGDTLLSIAKKHGVSVADIKASNGLKTSQIRQGQTLKINKAAKTTRTVEGNRSARKKKSTA